MTYIHGQRGPACRAVYSTFTVYRVCVVLFCLWLWDLVFPNHSFLLMSLFLLPCYMYVYVIKFVLFLPVLLWLSLNSAFIMLGSCSGSEEISHIRRLFASMYNVYNYYEMKDKKASLYRNAFLLVHARKCVHNVQICDISLSAQNKINIT